jgi:TonB family protein
MLIASAAWAGPKGPTPATPAGSPGLWVTTGDYPPEALRNHVEGMTSFRLSIDHSGRVSACEITGSSGSALLDAKTCELVRLRAKFTPATDVAGKVTNGSYANRVRWVMPRTQAVPEQGYLALTYVVDTTGAVTECRIVTAEGGAARPNVSNAVCAPNHFAAPYVDSVGKPVPKRITIQHRVIVEDVAP